MSRSHTMHGLYCQHPPETWLLHACCMAQCSTVKVVYPATSLFRLPCFMCGYVRSLCKSGQQRLVLVSSLTAAVSQCIAAGNPC